jgi:hypothetical protein
MPTSRQKGEPFLLSVLPAVIAWVAGATVFFRSLLFSGFDLMPGDRLDGRMIVYLHEHLFRWLLGDRPLTSPDFYHPQKGVLGFSDAFLLDVLPYSSMRLLGLDPYFSIAIMFVALSALCFFASFFIFKRYMKIGVPLAISGAALATFPNNLYYKVNSGHLQFFAVYYIPPIILLMIWSLRNFPQVGVRSIAGIAIASTLLGLLFSTGYYSAWMLGFTGLVALVVFGIDQRRSVLPYLKSNARSVFVVLGVAALAFVVALIPFAIIYLPTIHTFPERPFQEYLLRAPVVGDMVNVSGFNYLWGPLVRRLLGEDQAANSEHALALTPGMTFIFLAFTYAAIRGKVGSREEARWIRAFALVPVLVFAGIWLLTLKVGEFCGFWIVFQALPGAGAIRAGARAQLLVGFWVVAALVFLMDRWVRSASAASRNQRRTIAIAALGFCIIEQVNVSRGTLSRSAEWAMLHAVPALPTECKSFLVKDSGPFSEVDAMWISLTTGRPTLNGRSGGSPPGWSLADPSADYLAEARRWIARSGLSERVCLYDQANRTWSFFSL